MTLQIGIVDEIKARRERGLALVKNQRDRLRILGVNSAPVIYDRKPIRLVAIPAPPMSDPPPLKKLPAKASEVVRLEPKIRQHEQQHTIHTILYIVAAIWGIKPEDLSSPSHARKFSDPRQAAYKLIRERLNYSTSIIGRMIGNRDHTTILAGIRRCEVHLVNSDFRAKYEAARAIVFAP